MSKFTKTYVVDSADDLMNLLDVNPVEGCIIVEEGIYNITNTLYLNNNSKS